MSEASRAARRFTLDEANELLPQVRRITADAVRQVDAVTARLQTMTPGDAHHAELETRLNTIVTDWARSIEALGLEPKGLWLVDFDTGDGYYCWRHPESAVTHYHGYTDGFAGRMKIV